MFGTHGIVLAPRLSSASGYRLRRLPAPFACPVRCSAEPRHSWLSLRRDRCPHEALDGSYDTPAMVALVLVLAGVIDARRPHHGLVSVCSGAPARLRLLLGEALFDLCFTAWLREQRLSTVSVAGSRASEPSVAWLLQISGIDALKGSLQSSTAIWARIASPSLRPVVHARKLQRVLPQA